MTSVAIKMVSKHVSSQVFYLTESPLKAVGGSEELSFELLGSFPLYFSLVRSYFALSAD